MNTNEKLLLGYSTQEEVSKEALLALKIHFIDNQHLAQLQAQNDLHFKVERLGDYYVTVIYPIHSLEVRNDLLLNLSPLFSDMFYMDSQEEVLLAEAESDKSLSLKVPTNKTKQLQKSQNLKPKNADLGLQWLVLLLLSTVGLIILVRNRKKLSKIKQGQDDMQDNQKKIEIEINTVGAQNA
ncbi:MAG: hypothetical protein GQ531_09300 [Sulfurovum sp.]|nr:hypothetical protein [Sulfurovum sp.]